MPSFTGTFINNTVGYMHDTMRDIMHVTKKYLKLVFDQVLTHYELIVILMHG